MKARRGAAQTSDMARWLFENSQDIFFVLTRELRLEAVNPAWVRATGFSEAESLGRRVMAFTPRDDRQAANERLSKVIAARSGPFETSLETKDGRRLWIEGHAQLAEGGRMIGVARDATETRAARLELETARQTQRMLSEAAGVGTWSYEPGDQTIIWSEEIRSVMGHSHAEMGSAEQFVGLLHPEEAEDVRRRFVEGATLGRPGAFDHRMRARSGRWTVWRVTYLCEPRPGGLFALKGISQDITELTRAREAAQAAEREVRELIESAPVAVAIFDRDLKYLVASGAWRTAFKLDHREFIGRTLDEVFPGVPKRFLRAQKKALAGQVTVSQEDRFVDSQGTSHWIRWEGRPWRDAKGEIRGMLAFIDDVSAVSLAKREAQANARRLKLALGAADAGVYEIDHVNKSFWASPEFKRLIGAPKTYEDARSLRFPAFHPDDLEHVKDAFRALRTGARPASDAIEARIYNPAGEARWVRIFHQLKVDRNGAWVKGVGLIQDIDDRKRAELALVEAQRAAEAGAEAKAAFLANMSHEIRTPLNGVMGVLHLLKSEGLSDEGRRMLEEALSCGQMLSELLNDVIDFSKIEAGRLELTPEPIDPAALARGVVHLLRPQAEAKGLSLGLEGFDDLGWVRLDPVRLRQGLFNLVGNAVKFTLEGSVTVRARLIEGEPRKLRLEVEDTGVGIPAEVQSRLFQRFDQGDASTTRRFGGSGLGLAITRRLAEMMDGEVGFRSTEGQGSVFWMEVAAPPAQAVIAEAVAAEPYLDGLRILVVEDNATNRMIATKLLENLGAVVETAPDGLIGVEAAARAEFDLILMDVQMPGIDGLEAARRIRALPGAAARTPIIALTANVMSHQRQSYLEAGMDGVVGKPISPANLLAEIARLSGAAADAGSTAAA